MGNWSDYILKLFQSTLPRRERLPIKSLIPYSFKFQSTLPRRERRVTGNTAEVTTQIFQSTLPRRERLKLELRRIIHQNFNPHSHEGSDLKDTFLATLIVISIHTPTKGATEKFADTIIVREISIHTPTKGATLRSLQH